jgi:phosphomannomutase
VTELLESVPQYSIVKDKISCPSHKIPAVLRSVRQQFGKFSLDTRDGVKVILPDGWLLVRGSNTEPIVRIVAEAKSEERAREMVAPLITQMKGINA